MKNEKTQHTPAPWKIDYQDSIWAQIVSSTEGHVVTVPNKNDEQKANAQLIASAPELLEALRELQKLSPRLRDLIDRFGDNNSRLHDVADSIYNVSFKAIAKAEGKNLVGS